MRYLCAQSTRYTRLRSRAIHLVDAGLYSSPVSANSDVFAWVKGLLGDVLDRLRWGKSEFVHWIVFITVRFDLSRKPALSASPKWLAGEQLLPDIPRWLGDPLDRHAYCLVEVRGQLGLLEWILWR